MRPVFAPFSQTAGAFCTLPFSCLEVHAFKDRVVIPGVAEVEMARGSPFSLVQDLGRGCVWVHRKIRIRALAETQEIEIGDERFPTKEPLLPFCPRARLHLGVHKAQKWEEMARRRSREELFPLLYLFAQSIPPGEILPLPSLEIEASLSPFFTPKDGQYGRLRAWKGAIESLFFRQEGNQLFLLSEPLFASGKMEAVVLEGGGELDFSWRKGKIERIFLRNADPELLEIRLPGESQSSVRLEKERLWLARGDKYRRGSRLRSFAASHGKTP